MHRPPAALDYATIIREQTVGIARRALAAVAAGGLPAGSSIVVEFATGHSGVEMPGWLRERYPVSVAVILEHQFWDLRVGEDAFSVVLAFGPRRETLVIPFNSLMGFKDEGCGVSLKFTPLDASPSAHPPQADGMEDARPGSA